LTLLAYVDIEVISLLALLKILRHEAAQGMVADNMWEQKAKEILSQDSGLSGQYIV
jgi:hypothetical protein